MKEAKETKDIKESAGAETNCALSMVSTLCRNIDDYGISLIKAEGRIASWNQGAERLFGHSKRAILGQQSINDEFSRMMKWCNYFTK